MKKKTNTKYTKQDIANAKKTLASMKGIEKILSHLYFANEDLCIVKSLCKGNKTYDFEYPFIELSAGLLNSTFDDLLGRVNDCRAVLGMEKIDLKKGLA